MAFPASPRVESKTVLESLSRHMLVDGYHIVMDLVRSRGNVVYDAFHDVEVLDFFSQFATCPVGYNHPKLRDPGFLEELTAAALVKPANSDIYTREMAEFVETFTRLAVPATHARHLFFVEGGTLAVENQLKAAFDWKIRKNFRKGHRREVGTKILHFEQAFHGRSGYTLSLTNTADPRTARTVRSRTTAPTRGRFRIPGGNRGATISRRVTFQVPGLRMGTGRPLHLVSLYI